jgi:hypothetical protein
MNLSLCPTGLAVNILFDGDQFLDHLGNVAEIGAGPRSFEPVEKPAREGGLFERELRSGRKRRSIGIEYVLFDQAIEQVLN